MTVMKTSMIKTIIHKSFRTFGLDVVRFHVQDQEYPPDFHSDEIAIVRGVQPWTMTSAERIYALIQAVRYVSTNGIAGAIVECGVWKGGSMAAVARTLLELQDVTRDLYLFDTFQGMSEPTAQDLDYSGKHAADLLIADPGCNCDGAPLETVKKVLHQTGYPRKRIHFVVGKVEDTIPKYAPESISLLRLDTDWYESTKHELVNLFPRLAARGPIIIDDYGHWKGARQACDEYFEQNRIPILLNRIDYTGRIAVKPCA
jgi:O-methyltransferase